MSAVRKVPTGMPPGAQLSKPVWFNDSPTVQVIVFRSLRKRFFSAR